MENWNTIYITDKNGGKFFNTVASPMSTSSEIKNLTHHIEQAKRYPAHYKFLDAATARLVVNEEVEMSDDELLKELGV